MRLEAASYPVVLHVHDEVVSEVPINEGSADEFKYLIERLPEWAAGMPIASKVRNGPRFAEVDVPVAHVAGPVEVVAVPRSKAKPHRGPMVEMAPPIGPLSRHRSRSPRQHWTPITCSPDSWRG
jgi:hypothetical protein